MKTNVIFLEEKREARETVEVSLIDLLGLDKNGMRKLNIVITDDLPIKVVFKNNIGFSSIGHIVIDTFKKLFFNPKSIKKRERVDLYQIEELSKELDNTFYKRKHISVRKRVALKKHKGSCGCNTGSCKGK